MNTAAFPVINSTLSPAHLGPWLSAQYGFKEVTCRVLKININHTYKVRADGEDYILRVYNRRYRGIRDVEAEVDLLARLKDVISISFPIANTQMEFIQEINAPEGLRSAVLFSFAPGKKMRQLTAAHNADIGEGVGRFHHFTHNKTIDRKHYTMDRLVSWSYTQLAQYIPEDLDEMRFIKACERVLQTAFSRQHLSTGVVHLDMWYDNMNVADDGTVTFYDFDNCGNGWLILDIGYYCMQLYFTEPDKAEYERKKDAFIKGYLKANQLDQNEFRLVPYAGLAIWIYYLGVAADNFDIIANFYLSENYVRAMIARVKDWLMYNGIEISNDVMPSQ